MIKKKQVCSRRWQKYSDDFATTTAKVDFVKIKIITSKIKEDTLCDGDCRFDKGLKGYLTEFSFWITLFSLLPFGYLYFRISSSTSFFMLWASNMLFKTQLMVNHTKNPGVILLVAGWKSCRGANLSIQKREKKHATKSASWARYYSVFALSFFYEKNWKS